MYKCKSCGAKLAENAVNCPNCGDSDPFYNKEIEEWAGKCDKLETLSTHTGKIIGAVLSFGFGIYGTLNGNHWYDKLLGLAFVVGSILYTVVKFMEYKEDRERYELTFLEYRQKREKLKL
jgi:RNA polymerase subunit RPABC4/transcription elongation factor Spt4